MANKNSLTKSTILLSFSSEIVLNTIGHHSCISEILVLNTKAHHSCNSEILVLNMIGHHSCSCEILVILGLNTRGHHRCNSKIQVCTHPVGSSVAIHTLCVISIYKWLLHMHMLDMLNTVYNLSMITTMLHKAVLRWLREWPVMPSWCKEWYVLLD